MNTEIIVALIASGGGLLGSLVGVIASSKLTTYRIQQLENKVEKHNTVIERTYKLEETAGSDAGTDPGSKPSDRRFGKADGGIKACRLKIM